MLNSERPPTITAIQMLVAVKFYAMMSIDLLPKKTYNCEPFGLMFMIDGSGDFWWCQYYSHYSKKSDERFPSQKGNTIQDAAANMLHFIGENFPNMVSA